jgi:hypothetical protein
MLFAAAAALIAAGCTSQTDQPTRSRASSGGESTPPSGEAAAKRDQALVRFVNADPRTPAADLWFGDQRAFSNIAYKGATAYATLPDDRATFRLRAAGDGRDLAANSEGLSEGGRYTIIAMRNRDGSARLTAVTDDLSAPRDGKAKIRMINGAARAGELSLAKSGDDAKIVDDLNFGNSSGFKEVESAKGYEIRREDTKPAAIRLTGLTVRPGHLYTIVVTGEQMLDAIHIEDQLIQQSAAVR